MNRIQEMLFKFVGFLLAFFLFLPGFIVGALTGIFGYGFMMGWDLVVSSVNKLLNQERK
jgi:hypothetical protein